jgi:hypothetical protein
MAVQFPCQKCQQPLSIASRKSGTRTECPECGHEQTVPGEEAAAAALAMSRLAEADRSGQRPGGMIGLVDDRVVAETDSANEADDVPEAAGEELVLFKRHTLYVQAALLILGPMLAFVAGYFVGRGGGAPGKSRPVMEPAAQEQEEVLMQGKLLWEPSVGEKAGDEGAVVIAIPRGNLPESTLSYRGLRPTDPPPEHQHRSVLAIEALGGLYARADASGEFPLVFDAPGWYHVLLISRHAARGDDVEIDGVEREEMREYFLQVENLIGRYKYRWSLEEIVANGPPIEHNFGLDRHGG